MTGASSNRRSIMLICAADVSSFSRMTFPAMSTASQCDLAAGCADGGLLFEADLPLRIVDLALCFGLCLGFRFGDDLVACG